MVSLIVTFWRGQALPVCDQMERELAILARALETAGFSKEGPWGNCISKNLTEMKGQEEWERVEESEERKMEKYRRWGVVWKKQELQS